MQQQRERKKGETKMFGYQELTEPRMSESNGKYGISVKWIALHYITLR